MLTTETFRADAEAVAAEHGHELAPWWSSSALAAASRCVNCHASIGCRLDGSPAALVDDRAGLQRRAGRAALRRSQDGAQVVCA